MKLKKAQFIVYTEINEEKAEKTVGGKSGVVSTNNSKIVICVVPTNEELLIAQDTKKLAFG